MQQITSIDALRRALAPWRARGDKIGFAPTMGNLHAGHLALVEQAAERAGRVVVSLFVNPTQFGPGEDFDAYPRTLAEDLAALRGTPCDVVFLPEQADLYPHGLEQAVRLRVPGLSDVLEGEHRPGHLDGVASVVLRLFHAVEPDLAVFGEKDYQQLQLIRYLVRDLNLGFEVAAGATVREADGLALSSRNRYLSAGERARAPVLYQALGAAAARLAAGERDFQAIQAQGLATLAEAGFATDYLAVRRPDMASPGAGDSDFVVLGAARLGQTRLIDTILTGG